MAAGKNPYLRYRIINACLSSKTKRYWTTNELINKILEQDLPVSPRTILLDIENMRHDDRLGYHAPIDYCWRNRGYYYANPGYTIDTLALSEREIKSLSFAREAIQSYKDYSQEFDGVFQRMTRERIFADHSRSMVVAFEKAPYYKGLDHLDKLYDTILRKQPLRIHYQKFEENKVVEHVFHPYFLKEYKKRWYALGWSEKWRITLTLALDRMKKIEEESVPFREDTRFNPEEYFKHTLGITIGKEPVENIVLLFTPLIGCYIKSQHIHDSQEILRDDEEGLLIQLKLVVNFELIALIQSYIPNVKVIGPVSLKERVMENLEKGRRGGHSFAEASACKQ